MKNKDGILQRTNLGLVKKRKAHRIHSDEIEIGPLQLRLMLGDARVEELKLLTESFICHCTVEPQKLVNFKSYLNELNDVSLKGWCSGCEIRTGRYIKTGEGKGIEKFANRMRKLNKG